ncbi:MAG TPA: GNAT family N-acetyltransferase [Pyrinomonadaceae bacterium]|jgi:ribosomal protein S18 acetylase RimI-like enzyme|nr:GNAT family N-acetyltransferase [Pyrinomonadaceae bacterium]
MLNGGEGIELAGGAVITLRPVTGDDYEEMVRVYASTRADELALVPWDDAQKLAFCRMQYEAQKKDYDARFPGAEYDVLMLDGRTAGRVWIGRDEREIRLLDIALLPWARNRGVGTAIFGRLIEEARASGLRLRHMVFAQNFDALRFYERLGFVVFEDLGGYKHMEWRPSAAAPEQPTGRS